MVLHIFLNCIIFIITLGVLITVHEYGHFLAARFFKVKIEQFSIGFGPELWSWKGLHGTRYVISAFLIGGYVKLSDKKNDEIQNNESNDLFHSKSVWKRVVIVITGPIFNLIFSVLLYIIVLIIGIPVYKPIINYILPNSIIEQSGVLSKSEIISINNNPVDTWESVRFNILNNINQDNIIITTRYISNNQVINYKNYIIHLPYNWLNESMINTTDPIIGLGIFPNVLCVKSTLIEKEYLFFDKQNSLQIGDKILLIDDKLIYNWKSFAQIIKNNLGKTFSILIERNTNLLYINCNLYKYNIIDSKDMNKNINLFLDTLVCETTQNVEIRRYELFTAIVKACSKTWNCMCIIMNTLVQLFFGDVKIINLHGPIAIVKEARQAVHSGILYYLMFLAIVSINLGIVNLLPFPILDGGQLFFILLEKIKGNPISKKTKDFIYIISFVILIFITLLVLYNDVTTW